MIKMRVSTDSLVGHSMGFASFNGSDSAKDLNSPEILKPPSSTARIACMG